MDISTLVNRNGSEQWYRVQGSNLSVQIKGIKPKRQDDLREQCRVKRFVNRSIQEEVDQTKYSNMLLDESVIAWRNADDKSDVTMGDKPFPCNKENKVYLDGECQEFRDLWNAIVLGGQEAAAMQLQAERGN